MKPSYVVEKETREEMLQLSRRLYEIANHLQPIEATHGLEDAVAAALGPQPTPKPVAQPVDHADGEVVITPAPAPAPEPKPKPDPVGTLPDVPDPTKLPRVAIVVGHEPTKPGAGNARAKVYEYGWNDELADLVVAHLTYRNTARPMKVLRQPEGYGKLPGKINALAPDIVVSLHANAYNGSATGTETLYWRGSANGARLAELIQAETLAVLGLPDRGTKSRTEDDRGGYLLGNTKAPAVICEPFFIDNDGDLARANEQKRALAAALVRAIEDYFWS